MLDILTDPLFCCIGVCIDYFGNIGYFGNIEIRYTINSEDVVLGIMIGTLLDFVSSKY